MKRVIALFTDSRFLSLLGVVALSLVVWFGGAFIHIGNSPEPVSPIFRLITIMILVLLWGANNLRIQGKQSNQNEKMLDDIEASAEKEQKASPSSDEAKILHSRFKEAVDTLKTHRFGEKGKRKTIYELPWYVIIGPPGAGKTTVLVNSGLQFPLKEKFGLQGVGGIGGTRNCDWWFTDDAVLIDTAGRYTTQDSDTERDKGAWKNFLALLKKHRPRRAINGAIVAVSLQELLILSSDERQRHAETIRTRIQELMGDLKIRFPIYFVVTKCDLLAGFNEFFEYLDQSEREQVWGVSFPLTDEHSHQSADFFDAEFDMLVKRINDRVLWRLHGERDPYRKAKIQGFPNQFENICGILNDFVTNVFSDNKYQASPLLRGVYFTSGTQEGTPIDRILTSLSANYGVSGQAAAMTPGLGKSYFIHRLLSDVIFPESNIVGVNSKYEGRLRWFRRLVMFSILLVVLGAGAAWTTSLNHNQTLMEEVAVLIEKHKEAVNSKGTNSNRFGVSISIVEPLHQAKEVYNKLSQPWISGLGLYDESVQESAQAAYNAALKKYYTPVLIKRLESYLSVTKNNDALYDALRIYLMLGDSTKLSKHEVESWFKGDWEILLKNQAGKQQRLLTYLQDSLENGIPTFSYNEAIVQRTRTQLQKIPIEQRIYKQIERSPEFSRKSDFVQAVGSDVLSIFVINNQSKTLSVPYMFTKAGYGQMDLSKSSPLIRKYSTEQWILGTSTTEDFSDKDIEIIAKKVKAIYLVKYTEKWKDLLNQLSIRKVTSSSQAIEMLAKVSDKATSPLVKILKMVTNETSLTPDVNLLKGKEGVMADAVAALNKKALPPTLVDNAFKSTRQLIRQNKIDEFLATTKSLHDILEGFSFAPIPNEASMKFASKRFKGSSGDPIRKLRVQSSRLHQPVRRWMETLADQSWKVVLVDAKQHLNTVWQATVYRHYRSSIWSRYPFEVSSLDNVTMLDFTEYFKPNGIEDSFVTQYLSPFIEKGRHWKEKSINGRRLGLSSQALDEMQKAEAVRNVFFVKNQSTPGFDYKLKPRRMDSTVRQFELSLGDSRVRYSHGPKLPKSLSWPGDTANGVRLLFEDINETEHKKTYSGDWAFFKVLDGAAITNSGRINVFYVTFDVSDRKVEYELSATSARNPLSKGWLRQYQCPRLL